MKNIQYSKQALKFLNKQDRPTRIRIVNAINHLPSGDVKKLQGTTGYRLRVVIIELFLIITEPFLR